MKRFHSLLLLLLLSTFVFAQYPSLEAFLKEQPQIKSIEKLETTDFFSEKYKINISINRSFNK